MYTSWDSYPKIYNLGHPKIATLFDSLVYIEEKVDGSQFSWGVFDGELRCRSKGRQIDLENPDRLFERAIETALSLKPILKDGWTYRAEYLQKPKHNTLSYGRIPEKHLIIFDINPSLQTYLDPHEKAAEARRLGLEIIPHYGMVKINDVEDLKQYLERDSILGNEKIEGIVIKTLDQFTDDSKLMMSKYVSEKFKERHTGDWKKRNPSGKDFITELADSYRTEARWEKSIQHLRDNGELQESPTDIGRLMREIPRDVQDECEDEIKEMLFKWAWPTISRRISQGFPQFYKNRLLEKQFK